MEDKIMVTLAALVVLCILEIAALCHGINGQLFLAVLVIVAGVAGVPLGYKVKDRVPF
jgi:hypothetical protein